MTGWLHCGVSVQDLTRQNSEKVAQAGNGKEFEALLFRGFSARCESLAVNRQR
jgi:hypothetical protein